MSKSDLPSRRTVLKAAGSAAGLSLFCGAATGAEPRRPSRTRKRKRPSIRFKNGTFYGGDGKFDVEKGKEAIITLCEYHGYPIFPELREKLWVSDYGAGEFTKLGLAAYMFINNEEDRYMLLDLFLLPGQMLPEHWHVEGDHGITKNEGWLVRWGKSYVVGIGENNLSAFPQIKIPPCHCHGTATTGHVVEATSGTFVPLAKMGTRHWQYAGPQGAIFTEVANYHTNHAVRHSDPALNRAFLG